MYPNNKATDLDNLLYTFEPNGIERQEAHQQQVFTNNCDLPIKCDDWAKLEEWGVIKGEQTDPLFVSCVLPEGWTKQPTDHSMWSELRDSATNTTVKQFSTGHWGFISVLGFGNKAKKIVGLIYNGLFHYKPVGKYDDARFSETCAISEPTQISYDDFYKDFHHVGDGEHAAIGAARFLARQEAVIEAARMNKESDW